MALQPAIVFRLVRAQVVQHDMQLAVGILGDHVVHEGEKLAPAAARHMCGDQLDPSQR
jgi:hypothetical protein